MLEKMSWLPQCWWGIWHLFSYGYRIFQFDSLFQQNKAELSSPQPTDRLCALTQSFFWTCASEWRFSTNHKAYLQTDEKKRSRGLLQLMDFPSFLFSMEKLWTGITLHISFTELGQKGFFFFFFYLNGLNCPRLQNKHNSKWTFLKKKKKRLKNEKQEVWLLLPPPSNHQSWIRAITLFHSAHQSTSSHQINEHIYC